jgi:hypothetical protein
MATTKDNLLLQQIENNDLVITSLGSKKIKIRRLGNSIAAKFDKYTAEAEISYTENGLLINMSNNRKLVPKCVSLLILHGWLKVHLFHWIYWRYLDIKYTQKELGEPLKGGLSMGEYNGLLTNLVCLQDNSQIIQRATKGLIRNTVLAQNSEVETK